jgi:vitamin B12 transporter
VNVMRVRRALEPLILQQFRFLHPLWYHTNPRGDSQWGENAMSNPIVFRAVFAAASIIQAGTLAAEPGAEDSAQVDNIVVTAHLTPASGPEISSAYSVIERPLFERRQSIFAADILQDVPGVSMSRSGTFGSKTVARVRGAEANQVMVMIDGIRVNDLAGDDAYNFANLTSYDIDRVEVLRGPQSALYGSDAMAGVINVITRRADKPLSGRAFVEAGSFDTRNAGVQIGTAREKVNVNFGGSYLDTEGTNISKQGSEKDGYQNLTTTFSAAYDPTEKLGFDFLGRFTDAKSDFDDAAFGPPIDADRTTDASQDYLQGKMRLAVFDEHWTHEWRLTGVNTDNVNMNDGVWNDSTAGEKRGAYYQTSIGLYDDAAAGIDHRLTLAIDYQDQKYKQRGIVQPWGDPNKDEKLDNTGYVAEYVAQPLSAWNVSLALRYDDNSDFQNATTYRTTTSYFVDRFDVRFRGSLGTGQKNPTFTERFGFFTSASSSFVGNPYLKPEESTGWDVGLDIGFMDGGLVLKGTYFDENLDNEINGFFCDPVLFTCTAINEQGTSERRGLEAAFDADLPANLDLNASYTFTDATEPAAAGGSQIEVRRPRHMAALNINYAFVQDRGNLNFNASYSGKQEDDDFSSFPASRVELDAYTLVNLAVGFEITKLVAVTGRVDNLFDKDYENVYGFASPGRGIFAGVRLNFSN